MIWLSACPGTYCIVLRCIVCGTVVPTHLTPKFKNSLFPPQTLSSTFIWVKSIEGFVFFVFLMQTSDKWKVVWSPETKRLMSCCSSDAATLSPQGSWKIKCVLKERPCTRSLQCRWVNTGAALDFKVFLCVWKPRAQTLRIPRTMSNHWLRGNAVHAVSPWASERATGRTAIGTGLLLEYLPHRSDTCCCDLLD